MTRIAQLDPARYALPEELLRGLQTPALVVHLALVRANLARVLAHVGDPARWRVHVKTSKIPRVWAELPRAGLTRYKCATTREAAQLAPVLDAARVAGDVLVAFPLREPALARLAAIAREHPRQRWSVLCEDAELAARVPEPLGVFVDVDPGMRRTGVPLANVAEIRSVATAAGQRLRGVHGYDGHLHGGTIAERRGAAHAVYAELVQLVGSLRANELRIEELVTSGTPTFLRALEYAPFDELGETLHTVSPGTVVYHDWRTERENPELELEPAAVVAARVVSWPSGGGVTCDAGSKALAAEAGNPCAAPIGRPDLRARVPNEEHLPFDVLAGPRPARGTVLYLVPEHVCPTVNLAEEALLVEADGTAEVVAVSARAHELR